MVHSNLPRSPFPLVTVDRNQVQIALALADEARVRSLLTDCLPPVISPLQLGSVRMQVGVPLESGNALGHGVGDGVVEYEQLDCVLATPGPGAAEPWGQDVATLTRYQGKLHNLGWRVALGEAIALLAYGGFPEDQIQRILHLPWDGWHRSWWYPLTAQGRGEFPFQRWFRARAYGDGTYTLQYRDHYSQDTPPCFRGQWLRVPLAISVPGQSFGERLVGLRQAQSSCHSTQAILLAPTFSPVEEAGFIRQGISLYAWGDNGFNVGWVGEA